MYLTNSKFIIYFMLYCFFGRKGGGSLVILDQGLFSVIMELKLCEAVGRIIGSRRRKRGGGR